MKTKKATPTKIWMIVSDTDSGTDVELFATRKDAVMSYAATVCDDYYAEDVGEDGYVAELRWLMNGDNLDAIEKAAGDMWQDLTDNHGVVDTVYIEERDVPVAATPDPESDPVRDSAIRSMAKDEHASDGYIEIDENAIVSEGDDNGAYVAAWVWVDFAGTDMDKDETPEQQ